MAKLFKIESDVELEGAGTRGPGPGRIRKTMESLSIGESFLIPAAAVPKGANSLYMTGKRAGIKIARRKFDNGDVRVWRVA